MTEPGSGRVSTTTIFYCAGWVQFWVGLGWFRLQPYSQVTKSHSLSLSHQHTCGGALLVYTLLMFVSILSLVCDLSLSWLQSLLIYCLSPLSSLLSVSFLVSSTPDSQSIKLSSRHSLLTSQTLSTHCLCPSCRGVHSGQTGLT